MAGKKNLHKLTRKEYLAKWRKENPDYFKTYYKSHKKQAKESVDRYRNTRKGKATIKAYENSKDRVASKRAYQKSLVQAKKTLDKMRKEGRI